MSKDVREFIGQQRDRFLNDLRDACAIPSMAGKPGELRRMATWLHDRLQAAGCDVSYWEVGGGGPPIIWGEIGDGSTSLLSYSHYDVQPADPLDLWHSPPFELAVRDGYLYARGISDDKGDLLARIHAVEVYRELFGDLPLRLKFFVEGEEETGSPNLAPVAARYADQIKSDGCLWEGGAFDGNERYTLYTGLKGLLYVELHVQEAAMDLHSAFASMITNPAWRLVQALSTLKGPDDSITIDGFQERVRPLTPAESMYLERIPFDGEGRKQACGIESFIANIEDQEALRRFMYAPTCNICGIYSGFIEEGTKTVLPREAMAKLDFRLVPDLTPAVVLELLRSHLDRRGYDDIKIKVLNQIASSRSDPTTPFVQTVIDTVTTIYGQPPVLYPSHGGSGPMHALAEGLGMDAVTVGVGYAGMNMHAPNENIRLDDYLRQVAFLVELFKRFGQG